MDPEKHREIARKGGRKAHELGTAHKFTPETARKAGKKGGEVVSQDRKRMALIGHRGGLARAEACRKRREMMELQEEFDHDADNKQEAVG